MKLVAIISLVLCHFLALGQVTLDRQVIGTAAIEGSGSLLISSTAGQPEHTTESNVNGMISQGFQQPPNDFVEPLTELLLPACAGEDAAVFSIDLLQCPAATIFIDGEELGDNQVTLAEGQYQLLVIGDGCFLMDSIVVNFEELSLCDIQFFSGFSPNGDDLNDHWIIENIEFSAHANNTVSVFSRWGDLVWEVLDYNNADRVFSGVSNSGDLLPAGVYYYVFESGEFSKNGFIELMR
ncbi:MAG: gliding motility-associated-like protein [Flavobacteriales bacterium]|jgi:gliding motility-associated-like protein